VKDELLIAVIVVVIIIVFTSKTILNPNNNACNDDFCSIDYYKQFHSDPRFKT
jgi:hypothetical protein